MKELRNLFWNITEPVESKLNQSWLIMEWPQHILSNILAPMHLSLRPPNTTMKEDLLLTIDQQ